MKLSKPIEPNNPVRCLQHWSKELVDSCDGAVTLQYVLIEALLGLRSQGIRDGWANWTGYSVEMLDLLRAYLPSGSEKGRILSDLHKIQTYGEGDDVIKYEEIDRLSSDLFRWCCERPVWIHLPDGYQFWLDVPADAISTESGKIESVFSKLRSRMLALLRPSTR